MNRREFIGTAVAAVYGGKIIAAEIPKTIAAGRANRFEPKMIFDQHLIRTYFFYEDEMPPVENRNELSELMCEYIDYWKLWTRVNPPERRCSEWEYSDYKFNFERMKQLLKIEGRPFVWFAWQHANQINLILAGHDRDRFEYKGYASDQASQTYG